MTVRVLPSRSLSSARGRRALILCAFATVASLSSTATAQSMGDASSDDASRDGGPTPVETVTCRAGAVDCVYAPIEFRRREGLPVEIDWDTNWVPSSGPVQVRIRAAFVGHTEVRLGGQLGASWHRAFDVDAPPGAPASGLLETDYGIVFTARVRLRLEVGGVMNSWEGDIPFVPMVDFRATARANIDPWSWSRSSVRGTTLPQHIADVPLTDAIIPIPGISGGLTFDATTSLETGYRSTRISFAPAPDAITESVSRVAIPFAGGQLVEFRPRLEGVLDQSITITVIPALFVELLGRRWTLPVARIPLPIDTGARPWLFDAQTVEFAMPDLAPLPSVIDFGDVTVGETATRSISADNRGGRRLVLARSMDIDTAPYAWTAPRVEIAPRGLQSIEMSFAPTAEGAIETRVPLLTSDPDSPTVYVTARGRGVARAIVDSGVPVDASSDVVSDARDATLDVRADSGSTGGAMNGGCGCSTPTRSHDKGWAISAMLTASLLVARRRRRH